MLLVGQQTARTCRGLHRRAFLQAGASSVLGLSLADLLRARTTSGSPRARNVVLLWLWGGPSQLDTFDPKPNATLDYRGPFGTIPTRVTGVRFCELFPKLAGLTGKLSLVRTLVTQSNDHGIAGTIGLTGSGAGGTGPRQIGRTAPLPACIRESDFHPSGTEFPSCGIRVAPARGVDHATH